MTIRDRILGLRRVPARALLPHPRNWRTHPERQRAALRGILEEVGYAGALLARETADGLQLIDGHLRAETTPDQEVPVLVLDLDEAEAEKLLLSLDPIGALAGRDEDALRELFARVETESEGLAALLDDLVPDAPQAGRTDPDDVPEPPAEPTTRPGDLWALGAHRLLCGDSARSADVDHLLDGAPVHLVHTDPPYNVRVEPRAKGAATSGRARDRMLANDFVSDEEFARLLDAWFGEIARVLVPGGSFYVWGGYANLAHYPPALAAHDLYFSQAIVWNKLHPVLTRKDFMGAHEQCFYGWKKGAAHRFLGPANVPDLWEVKKVSPQSMSHLTEKPVELATRALEYSSRRGEHVLDLFGGSGSTLVAAERLERRAFLMELDPPYCDVIVRRWETFTGQEARRHPAPATARPAPAPTARA